MLRPLPHQRRPVGGSGGDKPLNAFPLRTSATTSNTKAIKRPPVMRRGSEKRKQSFDEDDEENDTIAVSSHKSKVPKGEETALDSSAPNTSPINPKPTNLPTAYYTRLRTTKNKHTIPLSTWDSQILETRSNQICPSEIYWIHKNISDLGPRKQKERCQWVNLITDITGLKAYNYFLCIPCERRPEYLPKDPRDASCELLKVLRVCLLRGVEDAGRRQRFERDAEVKAGEDVKKFERNDGGVAPPGSSRVEYDEAVRRASNDEKDEEPKVKEPLRQARRQSRIHSKTTPPPRLSTATNTSLPAIPSTSSTIYPSSPISAFTQPSSPARSTSPIPETSARKTSSAMVQLEYELSIIRAQRAAQQAKRQDMLLLEQETKLKLKRHMMQGQDAGDEDEA